MGTVRDERERRDLSLEELAAQAGISVSTLTRAERGDSVSGTTARRIARAFGVKSDELQGLQFRRRRGVVKDVSHEIC